MQHGTASKTESSKAVFENQSVVSFTSVHDGEGTGGSKLVTNIQSSGGTDVNQHESAEKDQPRNNSLSSAKSALRKSYHDAECEAMMQMKRKERRQEVVKNACSFEKENIKTFTV